VIFRGVMDSKIIAEILYHCRRLKKLWAEEDDAIDVWFRGVWLRIAGK